MSQSFEDLPQDEAIQKLVKRFYQHVLIDPVLTPFFTGHDIDKLLRHQEQFFKYLLYSCPTTQNFKLDDIHKPLVDKMGLSEEHFARVVKHLTKALTQLNAKPETMAAALALVESTKQKVLCESATS